MYTRIDTMYTCIDTEQFKKLPGPVPEDHHYKSSCWIYQTSANTQSYNYHIPMFPDVFADIDLTSLGL